MNPVFVNFDKSSPVSRQLAFAANLSKVQPSPSNVLLMAAAHIRAAVSLLGHPSLKNPGAFPRDISSNSPDAGLFKFYLSGRVNDLSERMGQLSSQLADLRNEGVDIEDVTRKLSAATREAETS